MAPTTLGVGLQHSCVIDEGQVRCWGANYNGEQNVTEMTSVGLLAVGEQSVCAHSSEADQIECWGWNGNGETNAPVLIDPSQLSAGAQHYCGLMTRALSAGAGVVTVKLRLQSLQHQPLLRQGVTLRALSIKEPLFVGVCKVGT